MLAAALVLTAAASRAQALFPALGEPWHDPALAAIADRYELQFRAINSVPFGISLDAYIPDDTDRALVTSFLGQSATTDFDLYAASVESPRTLRDIVNPWGEFSDIGMFGGSGAAADAIRYLALKAEGASASMLASARTPGARTFPASTRNGSGWTTPARTR